MCNTLQQIHLGSFNTEEEAAQAFDQEAIRLRGANTFTNFPSTTYLANSADSDHDASAQPRRPPQAHRSDCQQMRVARKAVQAHVGRSRACMFG